MVARNFEIGGPHQPAAPAARGLGGGHLGTFPFRFAAFRQPEYTRGQILGCGAKNGRVAALVEALCQHCGVTRIPDERQDSLAGQAGFHGKCQRGFETGRTGGGI
jgi:hypothetical protein